MRIPKKLKYGLFIITVFCSFAAFKPKPKPTIFVIGDSTVKNGRDDGQKMGTKGQWGWGHFLGDHFDTVKIKVENDALGGTSSRTFMNDGPWARVLPKIKPGDFVIMQFGHNDGSGIDEPSRARGTIKGNGNESREIDNPIKKIHETVYTYGWYIRKYISDIKAKGATPIVCSLIPRNDWVNGKVTRADEGYALWAEQAAKQGGAFFIPLNKLIADDYDAEGEAKVRATYFAADHTHTIEAGAIKNAEIVAQGIKNTKKLKLRKYLN